MQTALEILEYSYNSNFATANPMKFHHVSSTLANFMAIASVISLSAVTFTPLIPSSVIAQEAGEPVTTTSTPQSIALAKYLKQIGAKVYTTYWCPHCHNQKERFGKEAVKFIQVIECDRRGVNPQTQLCIDKKIRGFPTWEINGNFYTGDRSLEYLANLSGYRNGI